MGCDVTHKAGSVSKDDKHKAGLTWLYNQFALNDE